MPKFITVLTLVLFALVGVHAPAQAAVQLGVEAQYVNDALNPDAANINWWLTDKLALRGAYAWETGGIDLAALYNINPGARISFYLGLGENDVSGKIAPEVAFKDKAALLAGMEWHLSPGRSGLSVMVEAEAAASDLMDPSGNEPAPQIDLSLNYRFPPGNGAETDQDADMLAKLITLEAPDEPFEGQVAVAAVVLNRIHSNEFPDSIREVIYEPGQFKPASKLAQTAPSASASKAARAALEGSDPSHGALYFYNPVNCSDKARAFFQKNCQVTARIGNHVFLR